ncbi:MAG: tetratricopeptide repeat protein [Gammaproteobacteria bacterium]|nr:tetratricopeptide repeat protein [Gammaproteobacteria bacterium]
MPHDKGLLKITHVVAAVVIVCCMTGVAAADELLQRAEQLIAEKKAGEAYALLVAREQDRAGSPDFDLLLGLAALDAGHPTQAVFAFERVLVADPGNTRARSEIARAYFEMGENEAAKQEFTTVRQGTLPPALTKAVDNYLSAIEARFAATRTQIDLFIEGAAGYDSNVNSATDDSTIAIPAFGNLVFTLDDSGREADSGFFQTGAGTFFSTPFLGRQDLRIFGGGDIYERITPAEDDFRTRYADGQVGLHYTVGRNAWLVSAQAQRFYIDGEPNRDLGGFTGQWLHTWSDRTQFSLFGQFALQRFPDQEVRDVNQATGGAGVIHAFDRPGDPIVFASVYGGSDNEIDDTRQDIGRTFYGLRVGGQYSMNDRAVLLGSVSYQYSKYGADDPLFLETRKDDFVLVRAAVDYELDRHWSLRPEMQYSFNSSTLVINDFDRWQAFVNLRNNF